MEKTTEKQSKCLLNCVCSVALSCRTFMAAMVNDSVT